MPKKGAKKRPRDESEPMETVVVEEPSTNHERVLFDPPLLRFDLAAAKRSTVTPRDVASLVLWAMLPLEHPSCESPRWCFLKHKHLIRHCLCVYVQGLSSERLLNPTHLPFGCAEGSTPNRWLSTIRQLSSRGIGCDDEVGRVEYCPMFIQNAQGHLDADFFYRSKSKAVKLQSIKPVNRGTTVSAVLALAKSNSLPTANTSGDPIRSSTSSIVQSLGNGPSDSCGSLPATEDATLLACRTQELWDHQNDKSEGCTTTSLVSYALSRKDLRDHGFDLDEEEDHMKERMALGFHKDVNEKECTVTLRRRPFRKLTGAGSGFSYAVAVDCEMVETEYGSELARLSIVECPTGTPLLDTIVLPEGRVLDYLTRFSGITKELLESCTTTFATAQEAFCSIVGRETFVVGHSLENDFIALRVCPVEGRVVDTTSLYPHPNGLPAKNSLRFLAMTYLHGRKIQTGTNGHDSVEDAATCIDLVGLKLLHGPQFGRPFRENVLNVLMTASPQPGPQIGVTLIDRPECLRRSSCGNAHSIKAMNDEEAAKKCVRVMQQMTKQQTPTDNDNKRMSFTWVRLACDDSASKKSRSPGEAKEETAKEEGCEDTTPTTEVVAEEESTNDEKEDVADNLNKRLAAMLQAAPLHCLCVIMSAEEPNQNTDNRHSAAHGSVLGFVKIGEIPELSIAAKEPECSTSANLPNCKQQ